MPWIFVAILSLMPAQGADALSRQEQVALLSEGLQAFDRGSELVAHDPSEAARSYQAAAAAFQRLVDAGVVNGKLYYNLGNARLKCGQLGQAIAHYRRAEKLIPTDARLSENLDYARSLCRYNIPERTERAVARTLLFWHYDTPLKARFVAGLGAYALFWVLLIARMLWPRFPAQGKMEMHWPGDVWTHALADTTSSMRRVKYPDAAADTPDGGVGQAALPGQASP